MEAASSVVSPSILARKYRKKLRQIENLERLNRPLTEEENVKVNSKSYVREQLKDVLGQLDKEEVSLSAANTSGYLTEGLSNDGLSKSHSQEQDSGNDGERNPYTSYRGPLLPDATVPGVLPTVTPPGDHNNLPKPTSSPSKFTEKSPEETSQKQHLKADPNRSKPQKENKSPKKEVHLSKRHCRVTCMDGHSDIVVSLVVVDGRVVTASRDTCLKSWDLTTGEELRTFGGHTESVTCVIALDVSCGKLVDADFSADDHLIISSSFDCTFKMWSLNTGRLLKSVYTFNPLTKLSFCHSTQQIITGSDGGKLELWSLESEANCLSKLAFSNSDSVTGIFVSDKTIYCSSSAGTIVVYQLRDDGSLACLYVNEDVRTGSGQPLTPKHVRCITLTQHGHLLYGDDAQNLKMLNWKKGEVRKYPNHTSSYTSTDAVCCHGGYVLTSSYDLDYGLGYINVRGEDNLAYIATLDDQETERIICLDFCFGPGGDLVIVTGGLDLKLWHVLPPKGSPKSPSDDHVIQLEFRQALSWQASDSDEDSDGDEEEDVEDLPRGGWQGRDQVHNPPDTREDGGWLSWCSIL